MTNHHYNIPVDRPQGPQGHCDSAQTIIDDLARPVPSPDLTEPIMERLGYTRVDPAEARRHKRHRRARRLAVATAAIGVLIFGAYLYELGPTSRQMEGGSIPAAVGHDIELHRNQVQEMFRTIGNVSPERSLTPPDGEPEPTSTPPRQQQSPAGGESPDRQNEIDDAVNHSAIGDVIWV